MSRFVYIPENIVEIEPTYHYLHSNGKRSELSERILPSQDGKLIGVDYLVKNTISGKMGDLDLSVGEIKDFRYVLSSEAYDDLVYEYGESRCIAIIDWFYPHGVDHEPEKKFKKKGIAKHVFRRGIRELKSEGVDLISVYPSVDSWEFYTKLKFDFIGKSFIMGKEL